MPIYRKVIRRELYHDYSSDIYLSCSVNFTSNAVGTEAPDFTHLGIPAVNASDELGSFGTPATRFGKPTDGSNWSAPGHIL